MLLSVVFRVVSPGSIIEAIRLWSVLQTGALRNHLPNEAQKLKFWTKGLIIVTAVAGVSCLISWYGNSSKGDTQSPSTTSTIPAYQERQASPPHVYLEPEAGVQPKVSPENFYTG